MSQSSPAPGQPIRIWYQSFVDEPNAGAYWPRLRQHLAEVVDEGTTVDVHGITPFDSYAHPIVEFRCAREVICNAVRAEEQGYDAYVIGHFQDAGLYEARSVVDIPVLALGEASMLHACTLGQRSGIVTINRRFIPWFHQQITKYGLERRVTGVHALHFEPGALLQAFGDEALTRSVVEQFAEQAAPLVVNGVDVILPGGGIPMLLFSTLHGHNVGGAPVLNGIPVVVKMAELAVRLQRMTGMTVSRTADFIKPPRAIIDEFLSHPKGL